MADWSRWDRPFSRAFRVTLANRLERVRCYTGRMNKLIFPTIFLCGIFLTTVNGFAGRWTEVPGATTESSNLAGVAVVSANDVWAVGSVGRTNSSALIEHWDGNAW